MDIFFIFKLFVCLMLLCCIIFLCSVLFNRNPESWVLPSSTNCFPCNCQISQSQTCVWVFLNSTSCIWEELSWGGGMWGEHLAHFSTVWAVILASRSCGNEIKLSCCFRSSHLLTHSLTCAARNLWSPKEKLLVIFFFFSRAGWQLYSARRRRWRE